MKKLKWSEIKMFLSQRNAQLQFINFTNYYHVMAIDGPLQFYCEVGKVDPVQTGSDQEDFENNYMPDCNKPLIDSDMYGRPIVRYAATIKGWHYQAHSVQFEVNKLNSVYNKDHDGVDLGFAEIKVYDSNGDECTTQTSADTNGVKTIVTWKPDFDFEIISGNVRQITKETVDSYMHVIAKIYTGLPAPNDYLNVPFTQGGINLNYIGADEPLKTDGRASKLVKGTNTDHFQFIINYDANLITNENRHKMSVILEIYKDPMS